MRAILIALAVPLALLGCADTAGLRIPGASLSFPETGKIERAARSTTDTVFVRTPKDARATHFGQDVAKSGWTACPDDTLGEGETPKLIESRIVDALNQSGVFGSVAKSAEGARWVLSTDVRAFCAQTRGFLIRSVAGIVALDFMLARDGTPAWAASIERVVTDSDPDYSGSQITTVEQAMRRTMSDALRLVLREAAKEMEGAIAD